MGLSEDEGDGLKEIDLAGDALVGLMFV